MKICTECERPKEDGDFSERRSVCKDCRNVYFKGQREKNRDRRAKQSSNWRQNNPEKVKKNWFSYYDVHDEGIRKAFRDKYRKDPLKHTICAAKARAKKNGIPFNLERKDIEMPEFCPILGMKLEPCGETKTNSPSLDRIVPQLGYVKGNVAVISYRANRIKNDATADEHRKIADWMDANASNIA